jgi:hypothetical protein
LADDVLQVDGASVCRLVLNTCYNRCKMPHLRKADTPQRVRQREATKRYRESHPQAVRAQREAWLAKHPGYQYEYNRAYDAAHRERRNERNRTRDWLRKFGLTPAQYDALLAAQNGLCACGLPPVPGEYLRVDHSHETGAIRGLLHSDCNLWLGGYERVKGWAEQYLRGE